MYINPYKFVCNYANVGIQKTMIGTGKYLGIMYVELVVCLAT